MTAKYCLSCGTLLTTRIIGGTERKACSACDYVFWGDYSIGVGALVVHERKVLLVRRAQDPGKGFWTNPGGYVEQSEPIAETIAREVWEETGVTARVQSIVALRDHARSVHNVYIVFAMEYMGGIPHPDGEEVDAVGFFSEVDMQAMNVAGLTRWLVDIALHDGSTGLVSDEHPSVPLQGSGLFRTLNNE